MDKRSFSITKTRKVYKAKAEQRNNNTKKPSSFLVSRHLLPPIPPVFVFTRKMNPSYRDPSPYLISQYRTTCVC